MFTGIVEHVGTIAEIHELDKSASGGGGWSLKIGDCEIILTDARLGDSISVNGTCLTVTEFEKSWFKIGLAPETLRRTNLGELKVGDKVNLERAVSAGIRFGGHFVQGHVDTTATITSKTPDGNSLYIKLTLTDPSYTKYIIPKGYISIDGTSLTIIDVNDAEAWFTIMLVAYTQEHVIFPLKKIGDKVNIEVDMLGKYVEKIVSGMLKGDGDGADGYLENIVKKYMDSRGKT